MKKRLSSVIRSAQYWGGREGVSADDMHDYIANKVLDEFGWDDAPTLNRPDDIYRDGYSFHIDAPKDQITPGDYKLIQVESNFDEVV